MALRPPTQPLPQTLLARVAAGEPAAVRQCVAEYGPLVWSLARRFSPTNAEAEDAVQETFVELWRHAGRFDPRVCSEPAFITMIARRRMLERRHEQGRRPTRPFPGAAIDEPISTIEHCAEASLAASALATLDPRQRRALALAIGQGMDPDEIAELTALPVAAIRSLIRRALVAVRKQLLARRSSG